MVQSMKKVYLILSLVLCLSPLAASAMEPLAIDSLKSGAEPMREIATPKFIQQDEWIVGATLSYGTLASDNSSLLYLLSGIDAGVSYTSLNPFVGYFYRNNRCIGARLGYGTIDAKIDGGTIDFGESNDITFDIPYVAFTSQSYSYSVFHRNYLSLDKKGSFGFFAEVELTASSSQNTMSLDADSATQDTRNKCFGLGLDFNPGIVVFVLDNVSTNVSFGFGGLGYTRVKQLDADGSVSGSRATSQMRFKLNITDINFGVTVHL